MTTRKVSFLQDGHHSVHQELCTFLEDPHQETPSLRSVASNHHPLQIVSVSKNTEEATRGESQMTLPVAVSSTASRLTLIVVAVLPESVTHISTAPVVSLTA